MKYIILFSFVFTCLKAHALVCPTSEELSPSYGQVKGMLEKVKSGGYKTINEFLGELPLELRSNFIFIADTKSFQSATKTNPRVLLTSKDGSVRVTFNTTADTRGGNNIEVSMWNPATSQFEYSDLEFKKRAPFTSIDSSGESCMFCHGNPIKPNWESNPGHRGVIPYTGKLSTGAEASTYLEYLKRAEDKKEDDRLAFLNPVVKAEEFQKSLAGSETPVSMPYMNEKGEIVSTPALADTVRDTANKLQQCAVAQRIQESPRFENIKYLLAAIKEGCDLSYALPSWYIDSMTNYFRARIPSLRVQGRTPQERLASLKEQVNADTRLRQERAIKRNIQTQKGLWENLADNSGNALSRPRIYGKASVEAARLLLEPLGVPFYNLSTSRDTQSYQFPENYVVDLLKAPQMASLLESKEPKQSTCEFLVNKVGEKFTEKQSDVFDANQQSCKTQIGFENTIDDFINRNREAYLKYSTDQSYEILQNKCLGCHALQSDGQTAMGAPFIDFKNPKGNLTELIKSPLGKTIEMRQMLLDRINRPDKVNGRMPVDHITTITDNERMYLNIWLDSFKE